MLKLDEIQARAKNTLYVNPNPEKIGIDNYLNGQDVGLLIRAVRQLGAKVNYNGKWYYKSADLTMQPVDPDVLELLSE